MPATDGSLIFNTKIDTSGLEKDAKGVSSKVVDLRNKVSSTAAAVKNLREELDKTANTKVKTKAAESIERDIAKAQEKLNSLDAQADRIIEKKRADFSIDKNDDGTLEYFLKQDKEWNKLQEQIDATEEKLSRYKRNLEQVNAAAPVAKDTAEYRKQEERLAELTGKLDVYTVKLREAEQEEQQNAAQTAQSAKRTSDYKQYLNQTIKSLRMFVSGLGKAYHALKKTFSNTVGRGIRNIGKHFGTANKSANVFEKSLRRIKNMLVRMFFYRLVHSPIDAIKDGLGEISKISPEANKNLSALKTSSTYLKNSLAALAAPLLNLVTPAFVRFMDTVAETTDRVARLISVLAGQDSYTKTVKVQQDYAESLDKSTDSVKDNTKAVKENQKNLAKFDELNVMSDDGTDDNASSQSEQPMFENAAAQLDVAEKSLLNALKKHDWNAVGVMIGDKVNTALSKFNWKKIKKTAKTWATNIAELFNGFLSETDWNKVGETVAQGINTAISFVRGFSYTFDWKLLGRSIRQSLVSFFENLGSREMIAAFDALVNGIVEAGIELVGNPDEWKRWGSDLERNISDAIKGIDWENVKTLFHNFLKGVFNFGDGFFGGLFDDIEKELDGKDFNEIGHNAAKAVKDIDWEKIFGKNSTIGKGLKVISETVIAALDWLIGFLEEPGTAKSISEGVSTLLKNVDWAMLLITALTALFDAVTWITDTASELIDEFCDGLGDGFGDMQNNPELMLAITKLGAAISNMFISTIEAGLKLIFSALPSLIMGLIKLLAKGIASGARWIYEKIFGSEFADEWYRDATFGIDMVLTSDNAPDIHLPRIQTTSINGTYANLPAYATGTVVPANYGEFLAVLGDNRREPEVVSPVSSIKQAVREVLAENGYGGDSDRPINVTVVLQDGSVLFRAMGEEDDKFYRSHGFSRFDRRKTT